MLLKSLALALGLSAIGSSFAAPARPERTYHLANVEWHVTLQPDATLLSGTVYNTVFPFKKDLTEVRFDCGPLTIASVTVDGAASTYRMDGEGLFVAVPGGKDSYKIGITYSGNPTAGIYHVPAKRAYPAHTDVIYTQGEMEDTRYWLPTYDYPDDKAMTEGFITVPKGYDVLSNGALVDKKEEEATTTFHWKMDHPMSTYLISIVAGPYGVGKESWGSLPVQYWYPEGLQDMGKSAFGGTGKIIEFYSQLTGYKYPWLKFAQAAVPDYMFGGMENTTAVTQTISALHPSSSAPLEDSHSLVAHELAHQWFGDTVTCADWSNAWLNEGFATFLPIFYDRKISGQDAFEIGRYGVFREQLGAMRGQKRPVVWGGYEAPIDTFNSFIYAGGASRMFMLMDKLGEKQFWKSIKTYLTENQFKPVTTDIFFDSVSKSSHTDLTEFKNQWLLTPAVPTVTVKEEGSHLTLTQSAPTFNLAPEVWILDGKNWVKKTIPLSGPSSEIDLGKLAGKPVVVDPHHHWMMNIRNSFGPRDANLLIAYKALPAVSRMDMLGSFRSMDQKTILDLINFEKYQPAKLRLIGMLDGTSSKQILGYVNDKNVFYRSAGLDALSGLDFKKNPDYLTLIEKLSISDPNDDIRNRAFQIALNESKDPAMAEKGWVTDSFRDSFRNAALRFWYSSDKDKAREMCLLALDKPMNEPVRETAIRFLGSLKDKPGEHVVYDHLIAVVQEGSFSAVSSACNALASYGNPAAIAAIQPLTSSNLIFTKRAAEGAIERLKQSGN